MRRTKLLLAAPVASIIVLVVALLMSGCSGSQTQNDAAKSSSGGTTPSTKDNSAKPVAYQNPNLLVETGDLAKLLEDSNVRIIDVRKDNEYKAGHIKGAVNIPVEATFDPNAPSGTVGSAELIGNLFSQKGISNENRIIIYDGGKDTRAPRVFWTFEFYGDTKSAVLNGGFNKWQKENLPTTTEEPKLTPAKFVAKADDSKLATKEEILSSIGKPGVAFVDARSPQEYSGQDLRAKRGGRIPGAVNEEWVNLFTDGDTPVFKSAADLAKLYEDQGVTKDKEVDAY